MIENIVQTNQIFFTFSENRMSTLPSENSLEDAYNRSFWMVCVLSVCVCVRGSGFVCLHVYTL